MGIIVSKPSTFTKNADHIIKISRAAISLIPIVSSDLYFSDVSNWNQICFNFMGDPENEIEVVKFDGSSEEPAGIFSVSVRSSNSFNLGSIVIHDFDGGSLTISRSQFPQNDPTIFSLDMQFVVEIPVNPTLSASVGVEKIDLSWTPLSSIPDYSVYKRVNSGSFVRIAQGIGTSNYSDTDVIGNQIYSYYVVLDYDEDLFQSNTVSQATLSPAIPTLSKLASGNEINLSWTASSGATEYRLYKKINSGSYDSPIIITGNSYTDSVPDGQVNTYAVRAFSNFVSEMSNTVSYEPIGPLYHTLQALSEAQVKISWTPSLGAESYTIYYKEDGSANWYTITNPSNPYTAAFSQDTLYSFYVAASNQYGGQSSSTPSNVTTTFRSMILSADVTKKTYSVSPKISMENIENAVRYDLYYRPSPEISFSKIGSPVSLLSNGELSGNSPSLIENGQFIQADVVGSYTSNLGIDSLRPYMYSSYDFYIKAISSTGMTLAKSNSIKIAWGPVGKIGTGYNYFFNGIGYTVGLYQDDYYETSTAAIGVPGDPVVYTTTVTGTIGVWMKWTNPQSSDIGFDWRQYTNVYPRKLWNVESDSWEIDKDSDPIYTNKLDYAKDIHYLRFVYGYQGFGAFLTDLLTINQVQFGVGINSLHGTAPSNIVSTNVEINKNGVGTGIYEKVITWDSVPNANYYVVYMNPWGIDLGITAPLYLAATQLQGAWVKTNSFKFHSSSPSKVYIQAVFNSLGVGSPIAYAGDI